MSDDRCFIVFEGLDGAGTTTQAALLHDYFTSRGLSSFATFEPSELPTGRFIRDILSGRAATEGEPFQPGEAALALLFAADRLAHSRRIESRLAAGQRVVCDRYVFSSMAYQSLDPRITGERVVELNRGCATPTLTLFLSVPVDTCMHRIGARGDELSMYEKRESLEKIAANYEALGDLYRAHFGKLVVIDGTGTREAVFEAVRRAVEEG